MWFNDVPNHANTAFLTYWRHQQPFAIMTDIISPWSKWLANHNFVILLFYSQANTPKGVEREPYSGAVIDLAKLAVQSSDAAAPGGRNRSSPNPICDNNEFHSHGKTASGGRNLQDSTFALSGNNNAHGLLAHYYTRNTWPSHPIISHFPCELSLFNSVSCLNLRFVLSCKMSLIFLCDVYIFLKCDVIDVIDMLSPPFAL